MAAVPQPNNYVRTLLLTTGSSPDMNVDGSSTPVSFRYTVPPGGKVSIYDTHINFLCMVSPRAGEYGDQPELTNGLTVTWHNEADEVIFGNPSVGVTTNHAFGRGGGVWLMPTFFVPNVSLSVHFHEPLGFAVRAGDYLEAIVQDDLSGLLEHSIYITGVHS